MGVFSFWERTRRQEGRLKELEESERRLRAFLESASQGVVAIDPHGSIRLVNAKTEDLFGYRREELLGAPLEILIPEALRAQHVAHRADYFRAPRLRPMGVGMELMGRKKDGSEFPVEISLSFVREEGGQLALALITDISERKRLEEHMRQRQKLESLGVLAGGVAHDFNNLLTGILGNASLVQERLSPDSPMYAQMVDVLQAGQQAADLTRQLLAYAGKGHFYITSVNVGSVVHEAIQLMRSSIPAAVRVDLQIPDTLPPIAADAGQLQQLFTNLVLNAVEAIGEGASGTVAIRAEVVETDSPVSGHVSGTTVPPGKYVAIEVADDGCGMDEATVERIFEPFFTTKFTGRGLGLSAARGIVEAHHGSIRVRSAPGEGGSFTVVLPLVRVSAAAQPRIEGRNRTVLVVDDEEVARRTAKAALLHYGYAVLLAADGPGAIEIMREQGDRIRAVILDLTMPGMDGVETLLHLKNLQPNVPVLLSSGFSEQEAGQRFAGEAVAGFIQKPYTAATLARHVEAACPQAEERG